MEDYTCYADRLNSFRGWPNKKINREALAKAGFIFTKKRDVTKCPFCKISIDSWEQDDKPLEQHRQHSPTCEFIKKISEKSNGVFERLSHQCNGNSLPTKSRIFPIIDKHIEPVGHICHENYLEEGDRLETFSKWPTASSSNKPTSKELAEAGFFHNGIDDQTICFNCGICLKKWREKADPWEVHAYWNPKCGYVLYKKGYEFIQNVQRRNAGYRHY